MQKKTLSVQSIIELLGKLPKEKALLYDEKYMEDLYLGYQKNTIDDSEALSRLREVLAGKEVVLVGPGNLDCGSEKINQSDTGNQVVISINCIREGINQDFLFLCNAKRYLQMSAQLSESDYSIIATSNLTKTGKNEFDYILNYETLLEKAPIVADSATIMIMKILGQMGCKSIRLAGLDGYSHSSAQLFGDEEGADLIDNIQEYINSSIGGVINAVGKGTKIEFITKSLFAQYCS